MTRSVVQDHLYSAFIKCLLFQGNTSFREVCSLHVICQLFTGFCLDN